MAEPSLGPSLGATEIGVLLATVLYGVLNVQTYLYYTIKRENESLRTRILVPVVWFMETVHMFITWIWLYNVTVTHYGNTTYFAEAHWTLSSSAVFDGVIGGLVQGFFAHRIYILSGRWPLTIVSWIGSLCQVATNFAIAVVSQTVSVTAFAQDFSWITTTTLVLLVAVDLLNTVALCWHLRLQQTGVRTTDSMLNKLFQWTIQTGMVTVFCAIIMLATSLALSNTNVWISVSLFYAKLYSNCLLASLNGRQTLRAVYTTGMSHEVMSIRGARPTDSLTFATGTTTVGGGTSDPKDKDKDEDTRSPKPSMHVYPPVRFSANSTTKPMVDF